MSVPLSPSHHFIMLLACTHERTRARASILRALWGEVTRAVERESWFIMIDRVMQKVISNVVPTDLRSSTENLVPIEQYFIILSLTSSRP